MIYRIKYYTPGLSAHLNLPVKERLIDIVFNKIKSFNIQIEKKNSCSKLSRENSMLFEKKLRMQIPIIFTCIFFNFN